MKMLSSISAIMTTISKNPFNMSMWLLSASLSISLLLYKKSNSVWASAILVLTFSSGMMTLMIYTASSSPNELPNKKNNWLVATLAFMIPQKNEATIMSSEEKMKWFSSTPTMLVMATILIISMVFLTKNAFNPSKPIQTSF